MKLNIKPFIQRLIKENLVYIFGNIFIFILIIVSIYIGFTQSQNYDQKTATLKDEVLQLFNKVTLMNTTIPPSAELNDDLNFLNLLIPNTEDYFSIIYSLDKLSQMSNFIITSYNVNVGTNTTNKLRLSVTGQGDSRSFVEFLKNYNFGGGRLITSDKIKVDPNFIGSIQIDLTFYTKPVTSSSNLEVAPDAKIFQDLGKLKASVNFNMDAISASSTPNFNYPRKANPF